MEPIWPGSLRLTGRRQKTGADMTALNLAKLGETKVTVPLILIAAVALIGFKAQSFTVDVLDEFFFSEAQGQELATAVQENTEVLYKYIAKSEIREVNDEIREVNAQVTETQLWIAANGANQIATARLGDLVQRLDELRETKACLLDDDIEDKDFCYE
jgi:hypothetical protein